MDADFAIRTRLEMLLDERGSAKAKRHDLTQHISPAREIIVKLFALRVTKTMIAREIRTGLGEAGITASIAAIRKHLDEHYAPKKTRSRNGAPKTAVRSPRKQRPTLTVVRQGNSAILTPRKPSGAVDMPAPGEL